MVKEEKPKILETKQTESNDINMEITKEHKENSEITLDTEKPIEEFDTSSLKIEKNETKAIETPSETNIKEAAQTLSELNKNTGNSNTQSITRKLVRDAIDILEAHQASMSNFYQKKSGRMAPKRPSSPIVIAEQIGSPESAPIIQEWNAKMVQRFRPKAGYAPMSADTPRQILTKIENAT